MNTHWKLTLYKLLLLTGLVFLQGCAPKTATLPKLDATPAKAALPYDGTWLIAGVNKKIRIDSGRAFALDSWNHWGSIIEPEMVLLTSMRVTEPGVIKASDLSYSASPWEGRLSEDGNLAVTIQSKPWPVTYSLVPLDLDYPEAVQQEMASAVSLVPEGEMNFTAPAQDEEYASDSDDEYAPDQPDDSEPQQGYECVTLVVDPETNQEVCLD